MGDCNLIDHRPVIFVSGATHGLGLHLAQNFAARGASVAICGRNPVALEDAVIQIESCLTTGAELLSARLDVGDGQAVDKFMKDLENRLGGVDVVVSNAGIYGPIGPLITNDVSEWAKALTTNLIGSMNILRASAMLMSRTRKGRIIQMSGGGATKPMPNFTAYAASKAGVVRLVETLALELRELGIPVNAVAPGALNTRMLDEVLRAGPTVVGKEFFEKSVEQTESGGAGFDKATELIMFLAFDAPPSITGRLISAVWDDWSELSDDEHWPIGGDRWTLRRIEK